MFDPLLASSTIMVSHDAGQSWRAQQVNGVGGNQITLPKLYCDQSTCIVVGSDGSKPVIFSSQNQGDTWQRAQLKGKPVNAFGSLFDVACNTKTCIAVGNDNLNVPYITKSNDHGLTWNRVDTIRYLPNKRWVFSSQSLTCNEQRCFIGSYYASNPSAPWNAFLLSSFNQGETWEGSEIVDTKKFSSSSLFVSSHTNS